MSKRILIVDDDEENRVRLKLFFEELGYEAIEVTNGYETMRLTKEEMPQLILMAVTLPLLDGFSTIRIIRDFADIQMLPIIAMTVRGNILYERAIKAGFNNIISKPVHPEALNSIISQYLEPFVRVDVEK